MIAAGATVRGGAGLWGGRLIEFDALPSTNTWALAHAASLGHGDVVSARAQTAGRGRLDRSWLALPDASLTLSCVLKSPVLQAMGPNLGQVAACALSDLLSTVGLQPQLKWPNDVLVHDRKIAGILVESAEPSPLLVVGVGLNVNLSEGDFSGAGLDRPAISLHVATGRRFALEPLMTDLLKHLQRRLDLVAAEGLAPVFSFWAAADWLAGHSIDVETAEGVMAGAYAGLDGLGRLRLVTPDGERTLWTGDVQRLRRDPR